MSRKYTIRNEKRKSARFYQKKCSLVRRISTISLKKKRESSYSACKLSGISLVTSRNSRTFGTGVEETRRAERGMSADGKSVLRIPNSQVGWKVVNELDEERNEKSVRREKEKESTAKGNRVGNREERVRRK